MATNVIMPALGMDQETGTLIRWIKQPGEAVTKGEPLMEIETDKVVVEFEAPGSGVLTNVTVLEGDEIPVGQVIAQLVEPAELEQRSAAVPQGPPGGATPGLPRPHPASVLSLDEDDRTRAEADTNLPPAPRSPFQSQNMPTTETARAEAASGTPVPHPLPASPKARRLAAEGGLDLGELHGSGPEGAVLAADVLAAMDAPASVAARPAATAAPQTSVLSPQPSETIAVSGSWRVMADRMAQSWTTAPHFFLMRELNASALVELRARMLPTVERRVGVRVTYTDLLVKLLAVAIHEHPRVNASWSDGAIRQHAEINVGIAIAAGDALVVPVIRGADTLGIGEITRQRADLVERANAGKLTLDDLAGGTFTLTNLGMYNVDAFNAVINPPQAAILAVGRIADRVVAVDGQPAVRPTMIVSLSCDHRVVDGMRGALFLDALATLIEEPWGLLA